MPPQHQLRRSGQGQDLPGQTGLQLPDWPSCQTGLAARPMKARPAYPRPDGQPPPPRASLRHTQARPGTAGPDWLIPAVASQPPAPASHSLGPKPGQAAQPG
ncbi:proline-rich protein 2-like [Homarus americanus]|uniref:proline-rich protein 2-like n=1 Tax=Homarus americanus TaxID=6706 RepID=UPI001C45CF46|nr:proline-rich protein 2-like [Homarus americanus]